MAGRVIVGCSHGEENPDAVAVAYQLVQNSELQGATPMVEFAGDQAMTFTY